MLRFLAFLHDREGEAQSGIYQEALASLVDGSDHDWELAYQDGGLAVWCAGRQGSDDIQALAPRDGIVLGRLFPKEGSEGELPHGGLISRPFATETCESAGVWLATRFWGQYVAFLRDPARPRYCVIRDPTGALPCFHFVHQGVRIFFSDIADIRRSPLFSFKVNPEFIRASVSLPRLQKTITGLQGVEEVLPGEFWDDRGQGRERAFIWNPYAFAREPAIADAETASALVRSVTEQTIWTLARPFRRIVHHLGGLDSSIIHACLARAPSRPSLSLINFVTASPRGDERFYAREMATRYGASVREVRLDHCRADIRSLARASNQVAPLGFFDCLDVAADRYALEEVRQADALFYGVGGDNVFMQAPAAYPVLDYVHDRGIDFRLAGIIADTLRGSGQSAFRVVKGAFREKVSPQPAFDHVYRHLFSGMARSGFHPDLIAERPRIDLLHPLLIPPSGVSKGKVLQVLLSCFSPIEYYDQFFRREQVERIHVFCAQPIVEACLRIPSWILAAGGIDRSLARRAFKDVLPDTVLRRLTKGTPEEVYEGIVRDNRSALRTFLMDGILAEWGILCRISLERILSGDEIEIRSDTSAIINLFSWESWARNWNDI